jgi:hypothetical protein
MNAQLDDRQVYAPRGRNAEDDLADCILRAAKIFMMDGRLVWIADGQCRPVVRTAVIELCRRYVVTEHPVERDGKWIVERRPFVPTELMVRNLIRESLPKQVPVVQPEMVERPQEEPQVLSNPIEAEAGRRALARHGAAAGERLREEMEAGQRTLAKFRTRSAAFPFRCPPAPHVVPACSRENAGRG